MNPFRHISFIFILIFLVGCNSSEEKYDIKKSISKKNNSEIKSQREISNEFKAYWYNGEAELTSYQLLQERYGEIREGRAVTIFVTEDFLQEEQVKTNNASENAISVMKLNKMKTFHTGIYPYSIMTSIFNPIATNDHAIKLTNSIQEWCGQVYMQLNNRNNFEIQSHSYFEGEADRGVSLSKTWLEDELWNLIRINPEELPTGDLSIIPAFEYIRFHHKEIMAHNAFANIKQGDYTTVYTLNYPDLQRQLKIFFKNRFPYEIEKWEEINGAGINDTLKLRTTATKLKRMKTDYWNKNRNEFAPLRDSLELNL